MEYSSVHNDAWKRVNKIEFLWPEFLVSHFYEFHLDIDTVHNHLYIETVHNHFYIVQKFIPLSFFTASYLNIWFLVQHILSMVTQIFFASYFSFLIFSFFFSFLIFSFYLLPFPVPGTPKFLFSLLRSVISSTEYLWYTNIYLWLLYQYFLFIQSEFNFFLSLSFSLTFRLSNFSKNDAVSEHGVYFLSHNSFWHIFSLNFFLSLPLMSSLKTDTSSFLIMFGARKNPRIFCQVKSIVPIFTFKLWIDFILKFWTIGKKFESL